MYLLDLSIGIHYPMSICQMILTSETRSINKYDPNKRNFLIKYDLKWATDPKRLEVKCVTLWFGC